MIKKHVVITQTFYEAEMRDRVLEITKKSFSVFCKQKGLISIQTHNCEANTHTMAIMEWESKTDSENCMISPDFAEFNPQWQDLLATGKVNFKIMNYEVLDCYRKI